MSNRSSTRNASLLEEAADWVITLRFGQASDADRHAFEAWRTRSAAHVDAWTRAEKVLRAFENVSPSVAKPALQDLQATKRRQTLRLMLVACAAAPAGWLASNVLPWREWTADASTATGEQRTVSLPDNSLVTLNTATSIDIAFTAVERRVILREGEILITTHADSSIPARPFLVQVPQGVVQALGTRFSLRRLDNTTRVDVFEHAVEIRPTHADALRLVAGRQTAFGSTDIRPSSPVDENASLWTHGMLVARNMRLADVLSELSRYRRGFVRCDPAVADLRISGAIAVTDTEGSLAALQRNLPIAVTRLAGYWVSIGPA